MAMKLREARARGGRDPSELQGTARVEAIEALRRQPGPNAGAQPGSAVGTGGDGFCRNCDQAVKPVVRKFWGKVALFIATAQLVAVIVSVVACFTAVDPWKNPRRWLAAWPAAIHPVGLGVAAAMVAALAAAWFADFLNERAEQAASCPKCRSVLATQAR
jgi:hypothetical protein